MALWKDISPSLSRLIWVNVYGVPLECWCKSFFSAPMSKLKWFDVYGVPLSCWCKEFFKKLGGLVGEMVMLEDDTECKRRFDRGRFLAIVPLQSQVDSLVSVKIGNRSFKVRLKEHA